MKFKRETMHEANVGQTGTAGSSNLDQYDKYAIYAKWEDLVAQTAEFDTGAAEVTDITCIADTGVVAVQTLTFPAKSAALSGDFFKFEAADGTKYAVSVDLTGTDVEPTDVEWTSIPAAQKDHVDISSGTTAASVAALFETAIDAITGLSAKITTDDSAADGTMTLTQVNVGPVPDVVFSNADGSEDGSLVAENETDGVASNLNNKSFVISADGTDYVVKLNVNSEGDDDGDINPTIAAEATASQVATAIASAIDAEADFGASASTVVVTVTNANDAGSVDAVDVDSGFTFEVTTQGVTGIDLDTESFYSEDHGYPTGAVGQLTTTDTLPTGLSTATDYYIIKVDNDHFKFASSLSNANAGTEIDITGVGSGTHTFTPNALNTASIKLQYTVDGTNWEDVTDSSTNITANGVKTWEVSDVAYERVRAYTTLTAGLIALTVTINKKG